MAATNSVARRCDFARRRKSGREAFIVGSSHEIDAAEEDLATAPAAGVRPPQGPRSVEHTSELQSLMRSSYAVFCLKKQTRTKQENQKYNDNSESKRTIQTLRMRK